MGLKKLSKKDIFRQLNETGLTGGVRASQVVEAARLYIQSELPKSADGQLEPKYMRDHVLIVKSVNSNHSQALKEHEGDLFKFVKQATNIELQRLQFTSR